MNTGFLETCIFSETRDANGAVIAEKTRDRIRRLSWVNSHSVRKERSIKKLFKVVDTACRKLQVGERLKNRAFYMAKQVYAKGVLRGNEFSLITGAVIKLALLESKMYLSDKALLEVLNVSRHKPDVQLQRAYRTVKRALALYALHVTPDMMLPRVAEELKLTSGVQRRVRVMLGQFKLHHRPGPELAAAVYAASVYEGRPLKQSDVARACNASDVSLRARVEEMWPDTLPGKRRYQSQTAERKV